MSAIDANLVSDANRMTIGDDAMSQFHKNITYPLKALTALKQAAKQ